MKHALKLKCSGTDCRSCGLNRGFVIPVHALKFVALLMPTLVEKPPEGDSWIHEVKFDGYRSQLIIDKDGTRIYTRNGHDWAAKYRDR
ncbi:hypothetical protein NKJ90_14425 [Mesorhizobium sp. M0051]|uniref:hypothetical protein n=1 Tax=Mesorhizobium sp. M0051 TaxID=2956862 RepID=UPI00333D2AB0